MTTLDSYIPGTSEMARRIRELDWQRHPLGPIEAWPCAIRAAVMTCLASRSPMQIWWSSRAFVFYNDAFIPWLGTRHPAALGQRAVDVFADQWELVRGAAERVFVEGRSTSVDGLTLLPIVGDRHDVDGVICTFNAESISDEMLTFLTDQAREPMNAISKLLAKTARNDVHLHQLETSFDDLFDVVRLARGKLNLSREAMRAAMFLKRALHLARELGDRARPIVVVEQPRQDLLVHVDQERLTRAIAQLICEAQHSAQGDVSIRAQESGSELSIQLQWALRDSPAATPPRVISCLSSHLVQMHGGTVQRVGRGEVVVRLPLLDHHELDTSAFDERPSRVMIVEDDDECAHALKAAVETLGYEVVLAHDAPVAFEVASLFEPDALLVDIGLPSLDGWELTRRIRERVGDVPIIAVTGQTSLDDERRSLEAGCDSHLAKPVDLAALRRLLDAVTKPKVAS